jgi:hypothetical protein
MSKGVKMFLVNEKTGKKYQIVAVDPKTNEMTIRGEYHEWTEPLNKERFKKLGYSLKQEPADGVST